MSPRHHHERWWRMIDAFVIAALTAFFFAGVARAEDRATVDDDTCLMCHRATGLSRIEPDSGDLHLSFVSERYVLDRQGPHSQLGCVDCHPSSEVEVYPHDATSPVDCTQTCHVTTPLGAQTTFSHESVAEHLADSVHSVEAFAELELEQPLLAPGQSSCLYCHDQPVYRTFPDHSRIAHCETCHDEALPIDITAALQHTGSRLETSRPVMQTARVCATCHSDPAVRSQTGQHDAVTSYLDSFHGKASVLGDAHTATCTDCHRTQDGDVHGILSATDPASTTNPDNLEHTCMTDSCHATAVPELSSAGVHLRLTAFDRTPEFFVMAFFVVLTLGVLVVFFALILLQLLNEVVRPVSDEHRYLTALARAVKAHPEGRLRLKRQTPGQRVQHWLLAITFILLVLTGMPLKFATEPWAGELSSMVGGIGGMRVVHRVAAAILSATFLYHLGLIVYNAFPQARALRRAHPDRPWYKLAVDLVASHPMVPTPSDVVHFGQLFLYLLGLRKERPAEGKFWFAQKFEYMGVFWGMMIIGLSGAAVWANSWSPELLGGRALNFAFIMHSDEAFLAAAYIAVAHTYAVLLAPTVFPLSPGSLTGDMPAEEIAEGHAGYLQAVADELGITVEVPPRPTGAGWLVGRTARRVYSLALLVVLAVIGVRTNGFLVRELITFEPTVEVETLPLRLDATMLAQTRPEEGVAAGAGRRDPTQRTPLSHFHRIDSWYAPDAGNRCVDGGCHEALPHTEHKEYRSFLNMHTVYLDCQVCHLDTTDDPHVGWMTRGAHEPTEPPALLRLRSTLADPTADPIADPRALTELVESAAIESDHDPILEGWAGLLRDGTDTDAVVADMRSEIATMGPGQYGPKLGLLDRSWQITDADVADQLRLGTVDDASREHAVDVVHDGLVRPEVQCSRCHGPAGDLVDFTALAYPPERARQLRANGIAVLCDAVENNEVFYLPALVPDEPAVD